MKKIIILLTAILGCIIPFSRAQIKVNSNGFIGLGTVTPQYKLDIDIGEENSIHFRTWIDFFLNNTGAYGSLCFYPQDDFFLQLGKPNFRVGEFWACELPDFGVLNTPTSVGKKIFVLWKTFCKDCKELMEYNIR